MELHKNARTCPSNRTLIVNRVLKSNRHPRERISESKNSLSLSPVPRIQRTEETVCPFLAFFLAFPAPALSSKSAPSGCSGQIVVRWVGSPSERPGRSPGFPREASL